MLNSKDRVMATDGALAKVPIVNPVNGVVRGAQAKIPIQSAPKPKQIIAPTATTKPKR
jgi:hypothetical protein